MQRRKGSLVAGPEGQAMGGNTRLLFAAAAIFAAAAWVLPLWSVSLHAPQYPEGLGMHIRINTITGFKPNDLQNINNLNHYIGMKRIVPDAVPALHIMPWVVGALVGFAAITAAVRRRWLAGAWVAAFVGLAIAGMINFWMWEYDYGHNLDLENAIIKIPGMSYQPPLIGWRQLLNFRATSYPGLGALALMLSLGCGAFALLLDRRHRARVKTPRPSVAGRARLATAI